MSRRRMCLSQNWTNITGQESDSTFISVSEKRCKLVSSDRKRKTGNSLFVLCWFGVLVRTGIEHAVLNKVSSIELVHVSRSEFCTISWTCGLAHISETANVIKPTVSEKNGEIHASPTFHNAYLLIKNNVKKLPIIDCVTRFLDMYFEGNWWKCSDSIVWQVTWPVKS